MVFLSLETFCECDTQRQAEQEERVEGEGRHGAAGREIYNRFEQLSVCMHSRILGFTDSVPVSVRIE